MKPFRLTPLAKADIFDIWSYIAQDNENAANRVEQAVFDACAAAADLWAAICGLNLPAVHFVSGP